ncbi:MAG TPA: choice-of-anchor tandem repeat GloVer-containing protein [Chthonomonadaceae bacterium]|nr:choice-of-anchor tandem repeat GloVer-containing protein [Chthonomonadaceae bacterium]
MTLPRKTRFLLRLCFCLLFGTTLHAHAQTFTTLHNFAGPPSDGSTTYAGLVPASDGNLYGVTKFGGTNSNGTVFKITTGGTLTVLYSFTALTNGDNTDGANPVGGLILGSDGNLYGTTTAGGANGNGTIFKITIGGTVMTLHSFQSTDGTTSNGRLLQASDGNLYGTTHFGGANNDGTVFKITLGGTFTVLHAFNGTDGSGSNSYLLQTSDGNLYGTTMSGGTNDDGTIFKITTGGTLTVVHSFNGTDGSVPDDGLIQATDGNLYSTTHGGGANNAGTVFKITTGGSFTSLYSFTATSSTGTNTDGAQPLAGLIQASDGNLYGTCQNGGANGDGTLFQFTLGGTLTVLHSFNGTDGSLPDSRELLQASDGNLYGTTYSGGANSDGTVFRYQFAGSAVAPSDFNGDGHPDLLFQNTSTSQLAVWYMNGITPIGGAFVTPSQSSGWRAVGDADFNTDGKPDILFQNTSTNQLALWSMNGVTATGGQILSSTPPAGWNVVSLADFNADGHPDLLLQNSSTGRLAIWYMSGATVTDGTYVTPSPASGWTAVGSGDFNGDGKQDILLQNYSTGQLAVWYMNNNATATGGAYITPSQQAGWKCVSVIDLNADGHPDLLFQNTSTGKLVYWLLNGVQAIDGNAFSTQPQSGWQVMGPH